MARKTRKNIVEGQVDLLANPSESYDDIGQPAHLANHARAANAADLSGGPVRVSTADIEAGKLVWKSDAGASGEAHITFNVKDDAGFGDVTGYNTSKDANTLTIKAAANGPAIVGGDLTGSVTEDVGRQSTSGKLTIIDVPGEDMFEPISLNGRLGLFTLTASGDWTYQTFDDLSSMPNGTNPDTFEVYTKDFTKTVVTVNVIGVNDPPVLDNPGNRWLEYEETVINGTVSASDPDHDHLSIGVWTAPSHGTVMAWGETYSYTPNQDYVGLDSFTLSISDGHGGSALHYVSVQLMPVNDGPTAESNTFAMKQGDSRTLSLEDFGFADTRDAQWGSGNNFHMLEIGRADGPGVLWFDGRPLTDTNEVLAADIAAGKLVWKSDPGAKGQLEMGFYLRDDGANGARDNNRSDQNTLTIKLVDINEAPSFTLGAN